MRLKMTFSPLNDFAYSTVNKHSIQGMIHETLGGTSYEDLHDRPMKLFSFSDVFPITDYVHDQAKTLLLSSPDQHLVHTLADSLRKKGVLEINSHPVRVNEVTVFDLPYRGRMISGSPVAIKDKETGKWAVPSQPNGLQKIMDRMLELAKKKYEAFYGEVPSYDTPLFDKMVFSREVAVHTMKGGEEYFVIGTVWSLLEKHTKGPSYRFYKFVQDAGLGELTGSGFGFLNPVR